MCSGSNSFGFVIRSVCFSYFLATPHTAFQMTVGSLPWATPRTRFLIAQCFRLPLLYRLVSMMARTFNDVYCTSPGEPGLGRKTTPIQWICCVYFRRALSPFCSWFSVFGLFVLFFLCLGLPFWFLFFVFFCYFQYLTVRACLTLSTFSCFV